MQKIVILTLVLLLGNVTDARFQMMQPVFKAAHATKSFSKGFTSVVKQTPAAVKNFFQKAQVKNAGLSSIAANQPWSNAANAAINNPINQQVQQVPMGFDGGSCSVMGGDCAGAINNLGMNAQQPINNAAALNLQNNAIPNGLNNIQNNAASLQANSYAAINQPAAAAINNPAAYAVNQPAAAAINPQAAAATPMGFAAEPITNNAIKGQAAINNNINPVANNIQNNINGINMQGSLNPKLNAQANNGIAGWNSKVQSQQAQQIQANGALNKINNKAVNQGAINAQYQQAQSINSAAQEAIQQESAHVPMGFALH